MATWIFRSHLPAGSSFSGQIVYGSTTIDVPTDLIRYIDTIDISSLPRYINKYTGVETTKYKILNTTVGSPSDDIETEIRVVLVDKLPRYLFNMLYSFAIGVNGGGMQLYFYDDIVSDFQYTCRWINAADFMEQDTLYGSLSIDLKSWERQPI